MKKNIILGFVAFAIFAVFGGVVAISAYQGDPEVVGPNYTVDRHEAMQNAFENVDYEQWYSLMTQDGRTPGVLRKVNAGNFATFVEMRDAMVAGDSVLADELRAELGMGQGNRGSGKSNGQGQHGGQGNGQGSMSGGCLR